MFKFFFMKMSFYSFLCSFVSYLFLQKVQKYQSDWVVILDVPVAGEIMQVLYIFSSVHQFLFITNKILFDSVWFTTRYLVFYLVYNLQIYVIFPYLNSFNIKLLALASQKQINHSSQSKDDFPILALDFISVKFLGNVWK